MEKNFFSNQYPSLLKTALQMDGIKIQREPYLAEVLDKYCYEHVVKLAIETTPNQAGVLEIIINLIAKAEIMEEAQRIAKGSFITALPGGILGVASVFGEVTTYFCFSLRIIQKLVYLYGGDEFNLEDDEFINRFACFLGIMFDVNSPVKEFEQYAMYALIPHIERQIMSQVLFKTLSGPVSKKIIQKIGFKISKRSFLKGVSKAIPVGGAYVSSKVAKSYFIAQGEELQKFLQQLEKKSRSYYSILL